MTQSLEEVRFRVIETPPPDAENLASQIYATYVAPASEPDAASLPNGAPSEPEDFVREEDKAAPPIAAPSWG